MDNCRTADTDEISPHLFDEHQRFKNQKAYELARNKQRVREQNTAAESSADSCEKENGLCFRGHVNHCRSHKSGPCAYASRDAVPFRRVHVLREAVKRGDKGVGAAAKR